MIQFLLFLSLLAPASHAAASPTLPPVSILRFDDESASIYADCDHWPWGYAQRQLRTQFESALVKAGFPLQERRQLHELYQNEYELPIYNGKAGLSHSKFKPAKYALAGALTEMGYCAERDTTKVALGGLLSLANLPGDPGLNLKNHNRTAKLKLVIQLIDVATAENIKTFEAAAESHESSRGIAVSLFGAGVSHASGKTDVIEAASAEAISQLVRELTQYFQKQD